MEIRVEPTKDSRKVGPDGVWCTVWGHVLSDECARAVYYVRYNDTALGIAEFIVSVGQWSDDSGERDCVAALGKKHEGRLTFMLVDAGNSSFSDQAFLGTMRRATDVRGTPLAVEVFRILDEVLLQDERVARLRARLEA